MEEIRLGTIGSGFIVHNVLNNVMRTDGIRLEAVYSRSEEKARTLADEYGCNKTYTDMSAFLHDEGINTVYIATPNLLHYEQTKQALLAGKNVICEKPFTTRLCDAEELARIAKERHLFLVEAAPTSFLPNFVILKRELKKVGRIRQVMGNYSQYSSRYDAVLRGEKPAIFDPDYAGGCLMDINFYNVLLNILLFGKPKHTAYYSNRYPGLSDTSGLVVMEYDGFISSNVGAKDTWGVNYFQIEGETGYIYVEDGPNGIKSVRVVTKTSDETFNDQPDPDRWFYEVQELTRLLLSDDYDSIYGRLDSTLAAVEVIEAARKEAGIIFPKDTDENNTAVCSKNILGIDIGGTHFRIGIAGKDGHVEHFQKVLTDSVIKSEDALSDLAQYLCSYMEGASADEVVIGFPGTLDRDRKTVLQLPNIKCMEHLPVTEVLSKKLGIPVRAERDVTLALCYDIEKYQLPRKSLICGLYFGTGVGSAIAVDGRLLTGKNGTAGEVGHVPVLGSNIPCGCGNVGCLENLAGGKYLVSLKEQHYPDTPIGELFIKHGNDELLREYVDSVAAAVATEVNLLDPDYMVIGGGVVNMQGFPRQYLEECIHNRVRKPLPAKNLTVIFTEDEPDKCIVGAAIYARDWQLEQSK